MRPQLLLLMLRFLAHIIVLDLLPAHVALLLVVKKFFMMMSRRLYSCFSFPFWHLMIKGE
jgi:hypothetical protein